MGDFENPTPHLFPRWTNYVVPGFLIALLAGIPYLILLIGYGASPGTTYVGHRPHQPIPYSHQLHVSTLGLDCRYCHTTVERSGFSQIPPSAVCMNCHHAVRLNSEKLKPLHETYDAGMPVEWKKVHDLPDYVFFNHSAHVNKGISCYSCHGRVDQMGGEGVQQHEHLAMGWCLKCHRDPIPNLRPKDKVTDLGWGLERSDEQKRADGGKLMDQLVLNVLKNSGRDTATVTPAEIKELRETRLRRLTDCSTCHR